jgi:hypothetical protein
MMPRKKKNDIFDGRVNVPVEDFYPTDEEEELPSSYQEWKKDVQQENSIVTIEELRQIMASAQQSKALTFDDVAQGAKKTDKNNFKKYLPPEDFYKPALIAMMQYMSEDDCHILLNHMYAQFSKDNSELHISPRVETAIISMMVDRA